MPTNNFPNIGYKTLGRDFNFYQKITVTSSTFGGGSVSGQQPDAFITFSSVGVLLLNEGTTSSQVVEYSFNGTTVHGELDPSLPSRGIIFDNRVVDAIWFRIKTGSAGPVTVRIDAWSIR